MSCAAALRRCTPTWPLDRGLFRKDAINPRSKLPDLQLYVRREMPAYMTVVGINVV